MACDICGKTGCHLQDVREEYQTPVIKAICSDCATTVNDHLFKMQEMTRKMNQSWLKKFMQNMRQRFFDTKE